MCGKLDRNYYRQILLDVTCPVQVLVDLASHVMRVGVATFHARCPFAPHDSDTTYMQSLLYMYNSTFEITPAFHDQALQFIHVQLTKAFELFIFLIVLLLFKSMNRHPATRMSHSSLCPAATSQWRHHCFWSRVDVCFGRSHHCIAHQRLFALHSSQSNFDPVSHISR